MPNRINRRNKRMELKDFIEQSVSEIVEATQSLKKKYNNPQWGVRHQPIAPMKRSSLNHTSHSIDFDVAVTTTEKGTAKAGSKIGISILGANINGETGFTNENCSRIKFSIPFYPEFINKE